MKTPTEICTHLGVELVELVAQRRGSVLLKAERSGEFVALKGYDPEEPDTYDRGELLRAEADILSRVDHLLSRSTYLDYSSDAVFGEWLVTRWIDGTEAVPYVKSLVENRVDRMVALFRGIAQELARVHDAGYLHGDVQSAHVIVTPGSPAPVFIDWGLGRRIDEPKPYAGGFVHYAAPEIAQGMIDTRTDIDYNVAAEIYSVGALLRLCLDGQTAADYQLSDPFSLKLEKIARGKLRAFKPADGAKERALQTVVGKCLALQPESRFASLGKLDNALAHLTSR